MQQAGFSDQKSEAIVSVWTKIVKLELIVYICLRKNLHEKEIYQFVEESQFN